MRTAIYGAGAMGTVLGAYIAKAGRQADLITRNASHVAAMKKNGAHIVGTADFTVPVSALTPDEMRGKYDIIFLMTKQRGNREICNFLKDYLSDDGVLCTMQNGLPEPGIASVLGEGRTLGCAVGWGATFRGDGCSELTSSPENLTFSLGAITENKRISEVVGLLSCMGKVEVEELLPARWAKLSINSAFSAVSAITGLTFGQAAKDKNGAPVVLALLNEAFATAEACGVKIAAIQGHDIVKLFKCRGGIKKFIALKLLPAAIKKHKNLVSGMYFDLKAGKKCDMEFINGVIVHSAKNFKVQTPFNLKTLEIASRIESGELQVGPENLLLYKDALKA